MIWAERVVENSAQKGTAVMHSTKRLCKTCGREFYIKDSDMEFYVQRGLDIPKNCFYCRKEKHVFR